MDKDSLSHTSWDCACHVVWIPKYRRKVPCGETRGEVGEILRMLVSRMDGVEIVEGSACPDHIHICLRIAPKHSVSNVVGRLKGKSAIILHERHHERGPLRAGTGRCGRGATTRAPSAPASRPSGRHVRRQPDGSRTGWRECPRRGPGGSGHRPVVAMPLS